MIEIIDLYKNFGENRVLQGVTLEIKDRETITIIGGSGGGKSVLLKHMVGLLKPDKGCVIVDGVDIARLKTEELQKVQSNFGFLFQGAALFDSLTVYENVAFGLRRRDEKPSEAEIRRIVNECLAMVGLEGKGDMKPAALSGGMKKRVGLARAIATKPGYILYDEPTTGLDPIRADSINNLIIDMQKRLQGSSIVVTHDMVSAYKISDRIAMLYQGKIVEIGTPAEIQNTKNEIVRNFIEGESK